jgi:hypothetical protein
LLSIVYFLQLAKQGARCDFGVFVGASSTNYSTLPQIGGKAAALKMYLNETFTTLKLDDISIWMKVLSPLTKLQLRAPTTLKSEGEVTSLSGADKREVRDNREKWWEYRKKLKYFYNCITFHIRGALSWHSYVIVCLLCIKVFCLDPKGNVP